MCGKIISVKCILQLIVRVSMGIYSIVLAVVMLLSMMSTKGTFRKRFLLMPFVM